MHRVPKLFLDASVVVAAVLSHRGPAAAIFDLAHIEQITILVTDLVIMEAYRSLKHKYPGRESNLEILFNKLQSTIKATPLATELELFTNLILDPDDRHILAGAKKYHVDVLVTHDRKHFFTKELADARLDFIITTPRDFMISYRKSMLGKEENNLT